MKEISTKSEAYTTVSTKSYKFFRRLLDRAVFVFGGCMTSPNSDEESYLHFQIRAAFFRGKVLGMMPLKVTSKGLKCKWISWEMLLSAVIYIPLMILAVRSALQLLMHGEGRSFEAILFIQIYVVKFVPYILVPITFWFDSHNLVNYYANWVAFQKRHRKVTGFWLQLELERKCTIMTIMNHLGAFVPTILWMYQPPYVTGMHSIAYHFCAMLFILPLAQLWLFNRRAMEIASKSIEQSFRKSLHTKITPAEVNDYKNLWINLADILEETGHTMYRSYMAVTLTDLWCLTSSLFGFLTCLVSGNVQKLCIFLAWIFFSVTPFYFFCEHAHWAPIKVKTGIQKLLKSLSLAEFSPSVQVELTSFLSATLQPLDISLGGYVQVNRSLFHSTAAIMVTYLVVLLQLKISLG